MVTSRARSQRTSAACDFCRRRKLGCDNAKPKCENCRIRNVECTYTRRNVQVRPSNARIHKLEEENARLREQLGLQSPVSSDVNAPRIEITPNSTMENRSMSQTEASMVTPVSVAYSPTTTGQSENGVFHGPASGTFGTESSVTCARDADDETTILRKNQLLAETTRQRQLEGVNRRSGKLVFRGIDPNVGMDLLSNFWNRQHCMGSIVYRPAFMRDMASNGPYFSELLLYAIMFAGSRFTSEAAAARNINEVNATGRQYRAKFEQMLYSSSSHALFTSKITTIQALLVVSDALFSWCNERSLSWHFMGLAINMMIDLGLHIDGPARKSLKKPSAEDTEIERRVFWAAFTLDKVQSIYQGRPTRLREHDTAVPIIFLDEYEELEDFTNHTFSAMPKAIGCPAYSVSAFEQLCKLSIIMDQILCTLYAESSASQNADEVWESAQILHGQLESWIRNLPDHLRVHADISADTNILPHTLSLMALYNSLAILIYRPFLSEGHLTSVSDTAAPEAFLNCATAALQIHQILRVYKHHFCLKTSPFSISYAAYVSATIHVRMAAQKSPGSQAHMCLRSCLEILNIQQAWSHGPKRTMKILLELMQRLNVQVGDFVALRPISCHIDESVEADITDPSLVEHSIAGQLPSTLDFEGNASSGYAGLPMDFQVNGNVELTDFDIDQFMDSFVFQPSTSEHAGHSAPPKNASQLNFGQHETGGGQLMDQDIMAFDDLFGLDPNIF